jgi:hypothetical protein
LASAFCRAAFVMARRAFRLKAWLVGVCMVGEL